MRRTLRAHRDEREDEDYVPEVLEREKHDSAFRLRGARERQQSFFQLFGAVRRRMLRRRLRLQELARRR